MCINPIEVIANGRAQAVACRKCKQCRDNRVRDWVGRCIAESQDAVATSFITMTYGSDNRINYGGDNLAARILTYSDVQRWLKRLRKSGHPLRYFLAGEYGPAKGRAHWHVLAFWQRREPNHVHGIKWWDDPYWSAFADGGHTLWEDFDHAQVGYVCKYVLKDQVQGVDSEFHMSRLPPLGSAYFLRRAREFVDQGLVPGDAEYSFPDVRVKKTGLPRKFMMRGAVLRLFCTEFVRLWRERYGEDPQARQHSDWLSAFLDTQAPRLSAEAVTRRGYRRKPHIPVPIWENGKPVEPSFDEHSNTWFYVDFDGEVLWWSFDQEGQRAWQRSIVTEDEAASRRAAYAKRISSGAYREATRGE